MDTIAAPWQQLVGQEVHGRYPLQKCLAEGDRQAVYETLYREKPAIIKLIRPDSSQTAFRLLAGIDAGKAIRHPNLMEIYDSGDIRMDGVRYVYAVMEPADDNLGRVLRERPLDPDELRVLLEGALSALDFLHSENLIHTGLKPSNVLAAGDSLKLSSDGLHPVSMPRGFAQAPGIYDAPETGSGVYVPASDLYSLAVLLREAATGTPTESPSDNIPVPFDAIVRGGLIKDPQQRWTSARMRAVLKGEMLPPAPPAQTPKPQPARVQSTKPQPASSAVSTLGITGEKRERVQEIEDFEPENGVPIYKKYRGIAIAGAVAAGIVVALLVRSAHHTTPVPTNSPAHVLNTPAQRSVPAESPAAEPPKAGAPAAESSAPEPLKPSPIGRASNGSGNKDRSWAVVAATYNREADATKRMHALRKHHNSLHPEVVSTGASRFLVIFGKGMSQQQAKSVEQRARRSGASRDAFVMQLE